MISYFTGKDRDRGYGRHQHKPALAEFTQWFEDEMTDAFGGIECRDITKGNPAKRVQFCPQIIADTFEKCMEILEKRGLL